MNNVIAPRPEDGLYHFLGAEADPEYRAARPNADVVTGFLLGRQYEATFRVRGGVSESS